MCHYYEQRHYGWKFFLFVFFNIATFVLALCEIHIPVYVIYTLATPFSIWTAWSENKENNTNDKIVYLLHIIGAVACVYCFDIILAKVSIQTIPEPGIVVEVIGFILISLAVLPGYFILRLYQHIINRKLEDAYWADYDARQKKYNDHHNV